MPSEFLILGFLPQQARLLVEILLILGLFCGLYFLLRKLRVARVILLCAAVILSLSAIAQFLQMPTLHWVMRDFAMVSLLALVVLFQSELRRGLTSLSSRFFQINRYQPETLEVLVETAQSLSRKRFGALFAIERRMDLDTHAQTGVIIDAKVKQELIESIFQPRTALHDGGMILDEDRIAATACVFPLSQREFEDRSMGLRHRAAIGLSEETDCICIVVSEETGLISLAIGGELEKGIAAEDLSERLQAILLRHEKEAEGEGST